MSVLVHCCFPHRMLDMFLAALHEVRGHSTKLDLQGSPFPTAITTVPQGVLPSFTPAALSLGGWHIVHLHLGLRRCR